MNRLRSVTKRNESARPAYPVLVAAAGERARVRFLEFFAANIRNPRTRRAYTTALWRSFWGGALTGACPYRVVHAPKCDGVGAGSLSCGWVVPSPSSG